jgi:hypothetical protein
MSQINYNIKDCIKIKLGILKTFFYIYIKTKKQNYFMDEIKVFLFGKRSKKNIFRDHLAKHTI